MRAWGYEFEEFSNTVRWLQMLPATMIALCGNGEPGGVTPLLYPSSVFRRELESQRWTQGLAGVTSTAPPALSRRYSVYLSSSAIDEVRPHLQRWERVHIWSCESLWHRDCAEEAARRMQKWLIDKQTSSQWDPMWQSHWKKQEEMRTIVRQKLEKR